MSKFVQHSPSKAGFEHPETDIVKTGEHFLVVKRREDATSAGNKFKLEAKDAYEHGIQALLQMYSRSPQTYLTRLAADQLRVFHHGDFFVVLDFNRPAFPLKPGGVWTSNVEISVYAQKGGPEQLASPARLPEYDEKDKIRHSVSRLDDERIEFFTLG